MKTASSQKNRGFRTLPPNARKILQDFFKREACSQILKQSINRNARSLEHQSSTDNIRLGFKQIVFVHRSLRSMEVF
jgi:hypothetical protein